MTMTLFCRNCDGANEFPHNWVNDADACKFCGSTRLWRTSNEPKCPYELTENDKRMLRGLRIVPE